MWRARPPWRRPFPDRREAARRLAAGFSPALWEGNVLMTAVSGDLLTARNATIDDLVVLLRDQQARKVDVVASASSVRAEGGCLVLNGTMPLLGPEGVTMTEGRGTRFRSRPAT